ncbi:MAG: glycosyltransferase [Bdellovibrionales bacterium]|nr:glycosyltransferase [Bdellovibrionales bacterium]
MSTDSSNSLEVGKMRQLAPIAIFIYNRPDHTRNLFQSLALNPETLYSPVYVYCDGLKKEEHRKGVEEARELVRALAPKHAKIIFRDQNFGLAKSLITGITELTDQFGKVIVLEDDIILSRTTLRFLNQALVEYENDEQVMHISAYMYPVTEPLPDLFFYSEITCWGWATWKRAWKYFNPDTRQLMDQIIAKNAQHKFDNEGTMGFWHMLNDHLIGRNDSWAIRWYASVFLRQGLCLHPGKSLAQNNGFDGTGVHCGPSDAYNVGLHSTIFEKFPRQFQLSDQAHHAMKSYRKNQAPDVTKPTFASRLKNRLKREIGRLQK